MKFGKKFIEVERLSQKGSKKYRAPGKDYQDVLKIIEQVFMLAIVVRLFLQSFLQCFQMEGCKFSSSAKS